MGVYMTTQELTLKLPQQVYDQVRKAAERSQRQVVDVITEALTAAAPAFSTPMNISASLAQLAYLNDAALWQAARSAMMHHQRERLAALHDKQQREKLTASEQQEEAMLLRLYRETILVRAQAAVILQKRGYDIHDVRQFEPLA
jgi:uncharacterized protein YnzC (UPF0291/DUF896 family)